MFKNNIFLTLKKITFIKSKYFNTLRLFISLHTNLKF